MHDFHREMCNTEKMFVNDYDSFGHWIHKSRNYKHFEVHVLRSQTLSEYSIDIKMNWIMLRN